MTQSIITGPDPYDVAEELEKSGIAVQHISGLVTATELEAAGVETAAYLIVTDPTEATGIPLAREQNDSISVIVYALDSVPDFARHLADLILDPSLIPVDDLVEKIRE